MTEKKSNRKLWGFYTIELGICLPAAYFGHGITWPLAALAGGVYLFFAFTNVAEKIGLAIANQRKGSD
jgi:hypothetical protein